jgi:hypothetical protein
VHFRKTGETKVSVISQRAVCVCARARACVRVLGVGGGELKCIDVALSGKTNCGRWVVKWL